MKLIITTTILLFALCNSAAQDFLIENVTVFNGETVVENSSVLVKDGIISEVGTTNNDSITMIDGSGKFLMPAMTNAHVHAWAAASLTEAAKAGVLNLLDMHGMEQFQSAMKNLGGTTEYARYFTAGAAATAPDGHGTQYGFPTPTLSTPEDADGFVADRINAGANYIKIIVEPWKSTLSHETVKALIDAAHSKETVVVVHISKAEDAQKVLKNGADGLVHMWWDKMISTETLQEMVTDKNFFIMPTLLTTQLLLKEIRKSAPEGTILSDAELFEQVKRMYDAGIPILAGTDPPNANINYGTDLYKELALLSEAGVPNIEVLKSATSLPPKHFNLGNFGMLKEGYRADMILLNSNPITDIKNISDISTIWKEGKVVANNE
ncbi:MAG: amidohydrolase [Flavobacteriaceae bacterium]|jgi:imidazolonepropionase-like amidohydrolase|nr:amidohydrolase [Flavobacteriaceae bacterium]MAY51966.1 amidohydrolase [Flavobacteriaceae bacterium]|tara:strand:- start:48252 stop:49391 length:1140 start_codon:yes stop_codon:yes gene_type:complete